MPRHYYQRTTDVDERIRRLEEELYIARHNIIGLMPPEVTDLLNSYGSCNSSEEFWAWKHDVIDRIVSMAERDPEASYFGDRGYCPLCKGGRISRYHPGFALPTGLTGHLLGHSSGNQHQCPVTHAAFENAYHSLRDTLAASEEAERRNKEERRKTERVFMIDPSRPPELLDEYIYGGKPRSPEELAEAEERLRSLGFQVELNENVVAYKFPHKHYLVLGDPRKAGRIEFRIFNSEGTKRRRTNRGRGYETFDLQDNWKNDLAAKFRQHLSEACSRLTPQPAGVRKRQSNPPRASTT
jgi:hypothetical protein